MMYRISVWSWVLLLSWPAAIGYGLAHLFPPKNLMGLVLGAFWLSGWLVVFIRDQRNAGGQMAKYTSDSSDPVTEMERPQQAR